MPDKYYAVADGRKPGVYGSWDECKAQVHQYSGATFKKCPSQDAAHSYIGERFLAGEAKSGGTGHSSKGNTRNT
ncbi:ribonuclease H-like [Lasioglossum baleicum]|uniref:ribonuclease H-like n=1 Tax=Lasioglossum baleicum TaxID=434251 RepID=UPI003FCEC053